MPLLTYDEAREIVRKLYDVDFETYVRLRRAATDRIVRDYREQGITDQGISSSDTSSSAIEMVRWNELDGLDLGHVVPEPRLVPPSEPGALEAWRTRCACGTEISSSLSKEACSREVERHLAWAETQR